MKSYTATEESMQEYSRIISALTQLDMQRQEYMQKLAQWEQEHTVPTEQGTVPENREETGEVALD